MKVPCRVDGIHFPQDFEDTLKMPCAFWGDRGLGNLPVEDKQILWQWCFNCPADELFVKHGVGLAFTFDAITIPPEREFKNMIPNYDTMNEEDQQFVQRELYKRRREGLSDTVIIAGILKDIEEKNKKLKN